MNSSDQELIKRLNSVSLSNVKRFSFNGYDTYAKVLKVQDADTITILFEYKDEIVKYNIRIQGIDAPELHSKISAEATLSKKGKEYLENLILNCIIRVSFGEFDKYGRVLATIYSLTSHSIDQIQETDVSKLLIEGGYVRPYDGGTKDKWNL
jgi:endonuclease YncB( thermonuclease family)